MSSSVCRVRFGLSELVRVCVSSFRFVQSVFRLCIEFLGLYNQCLGCVSSV